MNNYVTRSYIFLTTHYMFVSYSNFVQNWKFDVTIALPNIDYLLSFLLINHVLTGSSLPPQFYDLHLAASCSLSWNCCLTRSNVFWIVSWGWFLKHNSFCPLTPCYSLLIPQTYQKTYCSLKAINKINVCTVLLKADEKKTIFITKIDQMCSFQTTADKLTCGSLFKDDWKHVQLFHLLVIVCTAVNVQNSRKTNINSKANAWNIYRDHYCKVCNICIFLH